MFTGIIEEIGIIHNVQSSKDAIVFTIEAKKIMNDINLGDSISVNGVCLTVTEFSSGTFSVDVMPETVKSTSLHTLKQGSRVNLERAMAANGRFGGHIVSGHVDGVAKIVKKQRVSNAVYYELQLSEMLTETLIHKGSITIDGISLTIFGLEKEKVIISIIPHTLSETILATKDVGDIVNIECDMLGKYIKKFINQQVSPKNSSISKSFLEENGFY
ncbi:riboflavin synthase [Metabacillus sediminilitoris]|uniref:Riboflavin synthase n=1 Tax=Metabacillus sediminilitoris TaxID=2567941 RepID=A0A4S4C578_9BACI|nr:riboflavin synthase [Metabacillus sediminilitoris]QGQ46751.1 riboflavin synthase [Metabacillus sediminilitoris]THF82901.1 riboflavin synthase [Metabacillus sediminilitoris]